MAFMPLVAMLLCNHSWLLYAYVVDNIFPLFSVCVFGEIALTLYIAVYAKWCADKLYVRKVIAAGSLFVGLVTIYFTLVMTGAIAQSEHQLGIILGYLSNVATFVLYFSPFEKLKLVIATKSSAAIPVLLCGIIFVNSGLWLANGIIDDDLFIIVPNVVGVLLAGAQLVLYFVYRPGRFTSPDLDDTKIDVVVSLNADSIPQTASPKSASFQSLASPVTQFKK
ncbi:hypothetical protein PHYBOEH_011389 [Phytophthora boehmeriae]|uniref:Sugar transporter SWEET1 n=1 Tax=Phytophthora boehmeriae TaxID=109152 RepID=A0A8T1VH83_9STRA|nr:hypothetical protein PHYBOEH_011389 [Phytophthora boehmeriae]